MHRNPSVKLHNFAISPNSRIPRSKIRMPATRKAPFDAGYLNPIFVFETLPGDDITMDVTAFIRLATPIFPILDNLRVMMAFFHCPNRLSWDNWKKFMGEQANPGDSISYTVPKITSPAGGHAVGSIYSLMGIPCAGQITGGNTLTHSALPLRAYNRIYNDWFKDENLINNATINTGNGPDASTDYALRRRGKRPDYFTTCLPWPQKGNVAISLPLAGTAPIMGLGVIPATAATVGPLNVDETARGNVNYASYWASSVVNTIRMEAGAGGDPAVYADLSQATGATINAFRQANMIQEFLERDARGGTRYTEIIRKHFDVVSPDARLQRTEYLGGGGGTIEVNPVAQTTATGLTGGNTPQGNLAAMGQSVCKGGFRARITEHGYIIGIICVYADLTYQQGLQRHWSRNTRYDYYDPAFAHLGEQAVLTKEIYALGTAGDDVVFGYQGRWDEYRYITSEIVGLFNSTAANTIDPWHLAQKFTAAPTLNQAFIEETPPLDRILAVSSQTGKQLLGDFYFDCVAARQMPTYSIPALSSVRL